MTSSSRPLCRVCHGVGWIQHWQRPEFEDCMRCAGTGLELGVTDDPQAMARQPKPTNEGD